MNKLHFTGILACVTYALMAGTSGVAFAQASAACDKPTEVQGFLTCADVDAAKKEGAVVLYAPAGQAQQLAVLNEFNKLFPEIRVQLSMGADGCALRQG